jgi:hypothetical protein
LKSSRKNSTRRRCSPRNTGGRVDWVRCCPVRWWGHVSGMMSVDQVGALVATQRSHSKRLGYRMQGRRKWACAFSAAVSQSFPQRIFGTNCNQPPSAQSVAVSVLSCIFIYRAKQGEYIRVISTSRARQPRCRSTVGLEEQKASRRCDLNHLPRRYLSIPIQ